MAEPAESNSPQLTSAVKAEIQDAYRAWLAGRGFKPRWGQRQMIADIARTLTRLDNRLSVVEAGTGTGKTVAYCLAVIPIAKALDKRVVISTATVALQEQVVLRDLPDLQQHTRLDFSFTLAKGRARYVCLKRLEDRIGFNADLEGQLFAPPNAADMTIYRRLQSAFGNGTWDGDLDSWAEGVERDVWMPVTNDRAGCGAGRCSYYHQCPFFRARRQAAEADVVVANHDLVLADASLGGGVVLPPADETIFVLDEAHHLPEKTRDHFTASVRLRAATEWLAQLNSGLETMARRFGQPREVARAINRLSGEAGDVGQLLADLELLVRGLPMPEQAIARRDQRHQVYRFPLGEVPSPIVDSAAPLHAAFGAAAAILKELLEVLEQVIEGTLEWPNAEQAEAWLPVVGQLASRAEAGTVLFGDYAAAADAPGEAARWVTRLAFDSSDDLELTSAPLDPGRILKDTLWENCYAAVATSATLCALGDFERFMATAGIAAEARQLRIRSPFDFPPHRGFFGAGHAIGTHGWRTAHGGNRRAAAKPLGAGAERVGAVHFLAAVQRGGGQPAGRCPRSLPRAGHGIQAALVEPASASHRRRRAELSVWAGQFRRGRRPPWRLLPPRDSRQTTVRRAGQPCGRGNGRVAGEPRPQRVHGALLAGSVAPTRAGVRAIDSPRNRRRPHHALGSSHHHQALRRGAAGLAAALPARIGLNRGCGSPT